MANYTIYGTTIPYNGRVIQINNNFFGTTSGVLEGDSPRLSKVESGKGKSDNELAKLNSSGNGNNPVIKKFKAPSSPRYRKPDGGLVPIGYSLHQHENGTIMTEHSMGPNDNSVVVTQVSNTQQRRNTTSTRRGTGGTGGGGY